MTPLWRAITAVSRVFAWAGGAMIMVAALIVSTEVILRKLFVMPISGSDEIAGYLFAVGTSWALAYVMVTRGHVRIDALYGTFPRPVRAILDVLALVGLAVLVVAMADRGWALMHENYVTWTRSNTDLRVPIAVPQALWLFGIGLFLIAIAIAFLRALLALFGGDLETVSATIGIPSQQDEIKSELEGLGIQTAIQNAAQNPTQAPGPAPRQRPWS